MNTLKLKKDIRSLTLEELTLEMELLGEKKFRSKQIYKWVQSGVSDFEEMTNLSKDLRVKLENTYDLKNVAIVKKAKSADGTSKYLLKMRDGNLVEAVLMKYTYGYSICISTQVGCRMGCTFCASTLDGVVRNLTAGEMLGEIMVVQQDCGDRIGRVVLMGSGEPLDNYDEVVKFLRLVNHDEGLNISHRHITLSTCGIVPNLLRLADEKMQITLAVSLHASNNDRRSSLMPVNRSYPIEKLISACHYYADVTGRRVTFEYALIQGENDGADQALALAKLLKGGLFHVNLIPVNAVQERGYRPTEESAIRKFKDVLEKNGVETTIRRELGSDINAACGQLRKGHLDEETIE